MTRHDVSSAACFLLMCAVGSIGACNDMDTDLDQTGGATSNGSTTTSTSSARSGGGGPATSSSATNAPRAYTGSGSSNRNGPDETVPLDGHLTLDDGELEGNVLDGQVREFLGIPYAAPPVGELRFARAEPPEPWRGVREAKAFGSRCPQLDAPALNTAASDNEDCLYLNVWTPAPVGGKQMPVMVFLHGGGHVNGSASEPEPGTQSGVYYSGAELAQARDVVVVTLNYRLGVFGFLAHPRLLAEGSDSGNQGLWDQQYALQWVQHNIASFGGDPTQVTLFGQDSGGFDVCTHVASPTSVDLFSYAISQSSGCTTHQPLLADAERATEVLGSRLGCAADDLLNCLRRAAVTDLLSTAAIDSSFGPIVDGKFLPEQPRAIFDSAQTSRLPFLLGSNADEGTRYTTGVGNIDSEATFRSILAQSVTAPVDDVIAHYPLSDFSKSPTPYLAALSRILGDSAIVCPTYDTALRSTQAYADTYLYNFAVPGPNADLGATHGAELPFVFGTTAALTSDERHASERLQAYWTNFAKQGDPNDNDLLEWPLFTERFDERMNFELEDDSIVDDFRASQCAFWRETYDAAFPSQ